MEDNALNGKDVEDQTDSFSLFIDRPDQQQDNQMWLTRTVVGATDGMALYNPALRFIMALCGVPFALVAVGLLLLSPIMFGFMHDSPQSNQFPGTLYAFGALVIYLLFAALVAYYAFLLLASAWMGQTVYWSIPCCCCCWWGCQPRILARSSSPLTGILLLVPGIVVLLAYLAT